MYLDTLIPCGDSHVFDLLLSQPVLSLSKALGMSRLASLCSGTLVFAYRLQLFHPLIRIPRAGYVRSLDRVYEHGRRHVDAANTMVFYGKLEQFGCLS